jgi:hypothetical protein
LGSKQVETVRKEVFRSMQTNGMNSRNRGKLAASGALSAPGWRKQAGITTIGFLILATFISMFAYAAIRLTPLYLNYVKIAGIVDGVYKEFDSQNPTRNVLVKSISRRFDVESITNIKARDIKVTSDSGGFLVAAVYDHNAPFLGNVSFTVHFDKKALVRR